ncbi:MAG: hypothetical protein H5U01_13730, partial [Clostridia bacterium]|nr:hypothetical protein [Clostridia bacterium]
MNFLDGAVRPDHGDSVRSPDGLLQKTVAHFLQKLPPARFQTIERPVDSG